MKILVKNTVWGPRAGIIIVKVVKIVKIGKSRQVLTTRKKGVRQANLGKSRQVLSSL